ncbi:hypothetical protein Tco_1517143 [Tanacetum coccineum]
MRSSEKHTRRRYVGTDEGEFTFLFHHCRTLYNQSLSKRSRVMSAEFKGSASLAKKIRKTTLNAPTEKRFLTASPRSVLQETVSANNASANEEISVAYLADVAEIICIAAGRAFQARNHGGLSSFSEAYATYPGVLIEEDVHAGLCGFDLVNGGTKVATPFLFKLIPAVVHLGVLLRWFSPELPTDAIEKVSLHQAFVLATGSMFCPANVALSYLYLAHKTIKILLQGRHWNKLHKLFQSCCNKIRAIGFLFKVELGKIINVCFKDGPTSLKKWKDKFFLIDRRAAPIAMSWRNHDSSVADLIPLFGEFSESDAERLREVGFAVVLAVLVTKASQSRQHESCKSPTVELFDVDSRRISIVTVNTKEYHSDVLARSQG